jgi:putative peptidoglycan lipid II flippase
MAHSLLRSTALVSLMTLLSRLLGFVRDMVIARIFGAGLGSDAFFVAFKIPNFLRRLFAEGAFSQAFVPVLSEARSRTPGEGVRDLIAHVSGTLLLVLSLITAIGMVAAPWLIILFAPGFVDEPEKLSLAGEMLRITFPYLLLISLAALAGSILNSHGEYGVPAFTPLLLNLALIGAALLAAPHFQTPIVALAWGVLVGGMAQLLFQLPFLLRSGLLPRPRWGWQHSGVRKILKLMVPALFGSSVAQINLLFDTLIASLLVTGSVSWLYYSDRLMEFPLGVFGIAIATVILPVLSRRHATEERASFAATLDWALRWVALIAPPAALGLALLAAPLLITLFEYGEFTPHDSAMSALSLIAYAAGLPGFILVKVLAPGFYARQDTRTPVRIGIIAMVANMVFNVAFVLPLWWLDAPAHPGLALATTLSAWLNAALLYYTLQREGVLSPGPGWRRLLIGSTLASAAMALLLLWGVPDAPIWSEWSWEERLATLLFWIGAALLLYTLLLLGAGIRPEIHPPGQPDPTD